MKLARSFNFTFRYIDDVLSLNNSRFGDFVDRIYVAELRVDTIFMPALVTKASMLIMLETSTAVLKGQYLGLLTK
jgi:hypothetical protein